MLTCYAYYRKETLGLPLKRKRSRKNWLCAAGKTSAKKRAKGKSTGRASLRHFPPCHALAERELSSELHYSGVSRRGLFSKAIQLGLYTCNTYVLTTSIYIYVKHRSASSTRAPARVPRSVCIDSSISAAVRQPFEPQNACKAAGLEAPICRAARCSRCRAASSSPWARRPSTR